jgi:poly-gamma-glutamate capsule biosynthesis protein CapA/YwtB (metallophosphatase superfamily)
VEYSRTTSPTRPPAELFARSGAAAVIGAHPHVVGVREMIGETVVFHSLGNFIFDQYFSADVMHGLAVMLTFAGGAIVDVREYPTCLELNGRTCV